MTYIEWAATVKRGVTITPEMAFAAGRQVEREQCLEIMWASYHAGPEAVECIIKARSMK